MRILVLGATGMLGSAVLKVLSDDSRFDVWGSARDSSKLSLLPEKSTPKIVTGINVLDSDHLAFIFRKVKPDAVVNCIGLIKQVSDANNPLVALPTNSLLPHRMADLCELSQCRLIHISTDCVFSGKKGHYTENDPSDAEDLYGKSKHIGEVTDRKNTITLRTSIIGHELQSQYALLEWFLAQEGLVYGYSKAIFSGVPTNELARIIKEYVLPRNDLNGLYHVSADPISKFDLLNIVARQYKKDIKIIEDSNVVVDRSLASDKFRKATGYKAPDWGQLVERMWRFRS
ncbi:SDR family oxidoreductase [Marinobacter sp. SS13-12]|uniref:dTDP-4-dehydrorhamnose reductase family protein n=1 Tax=Marinobacter sp. SS13-12 TaxID=3050451 RepID=UPI002554F556|nr:SDR family oxidoreductase [Marinobacter sp. SS13-12]MDK8463850.1 SDR family oxidoreductase [Marinobacter sp. SS13-12]